jgi:hypothetical protein
MTKYIYKANKHFKSNGVERREFVKESDKTVWYVNSNRGMTSEFKKTSYHEWFDSFEEARIRMEDECNKEIEKCKRMLAYAEKELKSVQGLTEG